MLQNLLSDSCLTEQSADDIRNLEKKTPCASCQNCSMYSYYTTDSQALQHNQPYKIIHFNLRCKHRPTCAPFDLSYPSDCPDYQEYRE